MKRYEQIVKRGEEKVGWNRGGDSNTTFSKEHSCSNKERYVGSPQSSQSGGYLEQKVEESTENKIRNIHHEAKVDQLKSLTDFCLKKVWNKIAAVKRAHIRQTKKIRKLRKKLVRSQREITELREVISLMSYCGGATWAVMDWKKLVREWRKAAEKKARKHSHDILSDYGNK